MQNMPRYIFLILHHVLAFDEFLCTIFYNNVSVLLVKNKTVNLPLKCTAAQISALFSFARSLESFTRLLLAGLIVPYLKPLTLPRNMRSGPWLSPWAWTLYIFWELS